MRLPNRLTVRMTAFSSASLRLPGLSIASPAPSSKIAILDSALPAKCESSQLTTWGDGADFNASEITLVASRIIPARPAGWAQSATDRALHPDRRPAGKSPPASYQTAQHHPAIRLPRAQAFP